ncbi:MAG: 5'/3'-nucleotidase SurE [Candidatus Eisenbacteria bacterium]
MNILLTNDDGIDAVGLDTLRRSLEGFGELWVVAPEREHSAASHALTLHDPLRVRRLGERVFSISGTPTDCVLVAVRGIRGLMEPKPDLIVSGINHGPNMGDDITYSGTVAAAIEGRLLGLPALAFSNAAWHPEHWEASGEVVRRVAKLFLDDPRLRASLANVNIPDLPLSEIRGIRVTHLGKRKYRDEIEARTDPRGRMYYWIGGEPPVWEPDPESDFGAVSSGCVSVTPLRLDWTARDAFGLFSDWESRWQALCRYAGDETPR